MFAGLLLMPFYLIQGLGLSSSSAGLIVTVQSVLMALAAPLAGAISDRIGTRWPATLGMVVLAAAMYLLSRLGPASSLVYIVTVMGASGIGIGMFVAPNNSAMMGSTPKSRQGIAGGVVATSRYIGMNLGVEISGAIFATFTRAHTQAAFFSGIQMSFLVASAACCVGCVTSAARK
jgi:MFS family permease